ncbi:MAG: DUF2845 domain-containing protein [Desulfobacterales bacterium]|uniref:DUF2845 domain-containing protein n=1 Tax=Candidatus Desulfatibia profunda TaxID=2841695 RepID=A0A8J6NTM3_9BACT|nr:DUF2845 domain-containing protein [Candidatus Desulfatibia profunda]MBL7180271.1 DUF2845 domain-containing protein [Desulfobacterales bacterium]
MSCRATPGSNMICIGATPFDTLTKCGKPDYADQTGTATVGVFGSTTRRQGADATKQTGSFTAASNKVEKWYYDCGTGQFGKIVTFKGGKIVSIENSADRGTGDQKCW